MLHKSLVKAISKAGLSINNSPRGKSSFMADSSSHRISWFNQGGLAICLHVRRLNDFSEPQSDYFAGDFAKTIKMALEWAEV